VKREPLVLAFALLFPSFMAWLYFVVASPASSESADANPTMQALYAVGKVIQFGLPFVWVILFDRSAIKVGQIRPNGIRLGVLFGLAVAVFAFAIYVGVLRESALLVDAPERLRSKLRDFCAATPLRYAALVAFLSVINSFLEEYYWRWFVFARLKKYVPLAAAIVISSLGFMSHHIIVLSVYFPGRFWSAVVPFSLAIALGGGVWAWIYQKSGSLIGPWISHLIVDVAVMTIGYDLAFRQ
jgi:membrane protease YdiL (CAAX protease family)